MTTMSVETAERIAKRKLVTRKHDPHTLAYFTPGGSYMIATNGDQNDTPGARDLLVILRDDTVIPLTPLVNPAFVDDVKRALSIEKEI